MNVIVGVVVNAISEISADIKKQKETKRLITNKADLRHELFRLKEQIALVENLIELDETKANKQ